MNVHRFDDDNDMPGWDDLVAAGRSPAPSAEVLAGARDAVREAIRTEMANGVAKGDAGNPGGRVLTGTGSGGFRRRGRMSSRALLTAAAVAVAATATFVSLGGHGGPAARHGSGTTAASSASAFLSEVADVRPAGTTAGRNAPYWKVDSVMTAADGSRAEADEFLAHYAGSTSHLREVGSTSDKPAPGPWRYSLGTRSLSWAQIDKELPADPAVLRGLLASYADPGEERSEAVFDTIGDLLVSPASPEVRQALYRVAAGLPGVRLVGTVTDGIGRTGTAVERGDGRSTVRYIIDPSSGELLETVVIANRDLPAVPAGTGSTPPSAYDGVDAGLAADGSRPAVHAGGVVYRMTFRSIGPAGTDH